MLLVSQNGAQMTRRLLFSFFLFAILATAQDRKYITLPRDVGKTAPFSEAVLVGDTLYAGRHIRFAPKTGKPGATPAAEARLVMESLNRTIEAAAMEIQELASL